MRRLAVVYQTKFAKRSKIEKYDTKSKNFLYLAALLVVVILCQLLLWLLVVDLTGVVVLILMYTFAYST